MKPIPFLQRTRVQDPSHGRVEARKLFLFRLYSSPKMEKVSSPSRSELRDALLEKDGPN